MGPYISNMNELLIFNRRIVQNISSERGEEFDSGFGETSAKLCSRASFCSPSDRGLLTL